MWCFLPGPLKGPDGKVVAIDFDGMAVTSPGVEKLPQFVQKLSELVGGCLAVPRSIRPFLPPDFEAAVPWRTTETPTIL